MQDPVLIVAPTDDDNALSLATVLERDFATRGVIWDRGSLPTDSKLDYRLHESIDEVEITAPSGHYRLSDFRSIWWRRPAGFRIDKSVTDPKVRRFCDNECEAFFMGVMRSLAVPIINDPLSESIAARKPYQLATARKVGRKIPKTLMSNNPESVRAFWSELDGRCIYKPFTAPSWTFSETRELRRDDLESLSSRSNTRRSLCRRKSRRAAMSASTFSATLFSPPRSRRTSPRPISTGGSTRPPHGKNTTCPRRSRANCWSCCGSWAQDRLYRPSPAAGRREYRFFEVNPSGQFLLRRDRYRPARSARAGRSFLVAPTERGVASAHRPSRHFPPLSGDRDASPGATHGRHPQVHCFAH